MRRDALLYGEGSTSRSTYRSKLLRICHVTSGDLWGGAEAQIATLLPSLSKEGCFDISVVLFNGGRLAEDLKLHGIRVTVIDEANGPMALLRHLVSYLRSESCAIIHTHKPKDTVLTGLASFLCRSGVLVRTVHGAPEPFTGWNRFKMTFYEILSKLVNKYIAASVIAVSEDIREIVSYVGSSRVRCIPNGVDLDRVRAQGDRQILRKEFGILDNETVIGIVGRLTPIKGHETFLKSAVRLVQEERHDVRILVVGEGPLKDSLRALVMSLGIRDKVIFAGHRDDVYDVIETMDIFVLPSYHEGIPMVLLEAMALKRAVIASRVGGIPEVVDHGVNGLLVSAGNEAELTEACKLLMLDRSLAARLSEAARSKVETCFSSRVMCDKVASLYEDVVRKAIG